MLIYFPYTGLSNHFIKLISIKNHSLLSVQEVKKLPCVQEVVTPFYIVSYYIKWSNYFLDTRYSDEYWKKILKKKIFWLQLHKRRSRKVECVPKYHLIRVKRLKTSALTDWSTLQYKTRPSYVLFSEPTGTLENKLILLKYLYLIY